VVLAKVVLAMSIRATVKVVPKATIKLYGSVLLVLVLQASKEVVMVIVGVGWGSTLGV